ncbi:MAG TPA: 50S ribosomal protein L9 [Acidimicrobiales bacterium]|nr:50S ribosomal protein L9 [Acidimicrobiales bacterium]
MKVILRSDVEKVGRKGDVVTVADGFARNYLVPRGLAMKAGRGEEAQAAAMRRSREQREVRDRESAEELTSRLAAKTITITAKAGAEGRLFGSVTTAEIATAIRSATGIELDRRKVNLDEPIKTLGVHEVQVRLHADVDSRVTVEVVTQPE